MDFSFEAVRLWQRPVRKLLAEGLGTLPLAPLCRMPQDAPPEEAVSGVIRRIDERLRRETTPQEATKLLTATFVLTGIRFPRDVALELSQGVRAMRESSTYQYILDEGRTEEAQATLLRQGRKRFGAPSEETVRLVIGINDLARLRQLSERLLDVSSWQELLAAS